MFCLLLLFYFTLRSINPLNKMQTVATRIFDLLDLYVKPQNKPDALACKRHGEWVKYSSQHFCEEADKVSLGLLQLGVQAGDRIAIVSEGRPEWNIVDFGIQQIGSHFRYPFIQP